MRRRRVQKVARSKGTVRGVVGENGVVKTSWMLDACLKDNGAEVHAIRRRKVGAGGIDL
jgi:hypothetical protein